MSQIGQRVMFETQQGGVAVLGYVFSALLKARRRGLSADEAPALALLSGADLPVAFDRIHASMSHDKIMVVQAALEAAGAVGESGPLPLPAGTDTAAPAPAETGATGEKAKIALTSATFLKGVLKCLKHNYPKVRVVIFFSIPVFCRSSI